MAVKDTIAQLKQAVLDEMSKLQAELAVVEGLELAYDAELLVEFNKGFDAGVLQSDSAGGSDKIFSLIELNAELAPLQAKIVELEAAVSSLQAVVNSVPQQIVEGVAAVKAGLLAAYEAQQVAETQAETGFKDLLK